MAPSEWIDQATDKYTNGHGGSVVFGYGAGAADGHGYNFGDGYGFGDGAFSGVYSGYGDGYGSDSIKTEDDDYDTE